MSKLKKFKLYAKVAVGARTVVWAADEESARTIANDREVKLDDCYGRDVDGHWLIEEADGEPYDIEVIES